MLALRMSSESGCIYSIVAPWQGGAKDGAPGNFTRLSAGNPPP